MTINDGEKSRRMRLALATASDQYRVEENHDVANILSEVADLPSISLATLYDCFQRADDIATYAKDTGAA